MILSKAGKCDRFPVSRQDRCTMKKRGGGEFIPTAHGFPGNRAPSSSSEEWLFSQWLSVGTRIAAGMSLLCVLGRFGESAFLSVVLAGVSPDRS